MSIWCSWPTIGWDDEGADVNGMVIEGDEVRSPRPHWEGGEVRSYTASHLYPDDSQQPASVDLAHIPPWCVPGWRDTELDETDALAPWLRLSVDAPSESATVVMDEAAVRELHRQLGEWLEAAKVEPREAG